MKTPGSLIVFLAAVEEGWEVRPGGGVGVERKRVLSKSTLGFTAPKAWSRSRIQQRNIERSGAFTCVVRVWVKLSWAKLSEHAAQCIMLYFTRLTQTILFAWSILWPSVNITALCPCLFLSVSTKFLERGAFFNSCGFYTKPNECNKLAFSGPLATPKEECTEWIIWLMLLLLLRKK